MTVAGAPVRTGWVEANQRHLADVLATLRKWLAGDGESPAPEADNEREERQGRAEPQEREDGAGALDPPPALESLSATFGLSGFERNVLAMCAGVELDARFARACAEAQDDPRCRHVTFGLALARLPEAHWSALSPAGPLRRWRLVDLGMGGSLTSSPLRIDERVLHHLTGVSYLDDRLVGLVEPVARTDVITATHHRLAQRVAARWAEASGGTWPAIQLCGPDQAATTAVADAACAHLGLGLLRLPAESIPAAPGERTALARLCERELVLSGCALLLVADLDEAVPEVERRAATFAGEMTAPLLIAAAEPLELRDRPGLRLDVDRLDHSEQRVVWQQALGPLAERLDGHLDALVTQFDLNTDGIHAAAGTLGSAAEQEASFALLWDACRIQARRRLEGLAQRIRSRVGWDDLVVPAPQREVLNEIACHVRHARTVYQTWGFAARSDRGLGISALFAGPSGTGKTLAAEVLANELHLDLYRIDLSQVVSKYIGETEKNLRRIFAVAEQSGSILLFDEADALFGRRSEVKDSHDRYANIEVSYLLQRMEAYRGLAILTTNMKSALDQAFLRRIRFVVQFPFPDAAQREQIWRRAFPAPTPTEGLDPHQLARMNLAGGNIRNIAMNAAFLAAEQGGPVRMAHIARAARSEYAKLEKPLTAGELGSTR